MLRDNIWILTTSVPPENDQAAASRVVEFGGACLSGICQMVFKDERQLRASFIEAKFSLEIKPLLGKARVRTLKGIARGRDGTEYTMFMTDIAGGFLRVDNVVLTKAGNAVAPEDLQALKMMDEPEFFEQEPQWTAGGTPPVKETPQ